MQQTIHAQIRSEWRGFIDDRIDIVPGYSFSQYDTIKRIHLYLNSQFESGKKYQGRRKLFFNISKYRAQVATRMLDFDTKDIRLISQDFDSSLKAFLLEKEFAQWMKDSAFAGVLNEIAERTSNYGSCVLRKIPGKVRRVDLRNFALDPSVKRVWESPFILERRYMTEDEIRKQKGWDPEQVKALLKTSPQFVNKPAYDEEGGVYARGSGGKYYEIFERFGDVPKSWLTGREEDDDEYVRSFFVTAESCAYTEQNPQEFGRVLFKSPWVKAFPYWDFHYFQTEGRWLGIGVIEDLFNPQERENELTNQKRLSMEISSLHLFQTMGQTILQNVLKDARTGDVIQTTQGGELKAVATENRDLASFQTEEQRWDQQSDRMSFAYDTTRGESIGKSTPATNAVIQNNSANGVFDFKKEGIGIELRFFMLGWVLPELIQDLSKEHILRFTGSMSDLRRLDDAIIEEIVRKESVDRLLSGTIVTEDDRSLLRDELKTQLGKRGAERFVKVIQGWYKDAKLDFDFVITNEQKDLETMAGNLFQVLSHVAANPALLQNPLTRSLLKKYAEIIGIPAVEYDFAEAETNDMQNRQGAAPGMMAGLSPEASAMLGKSGVPRNPGAAAPAPAQQGAPVM